MRHHKVLAILIIFSAHKETESTLNDLATDLVGKLKTSVHDLENLYSKLGNLSFF
jgi:hypothetical protein